MVQTVYIIVIMVSFVISLPAYYVRGWFPIPDNAANSFSSVALPSPPPNNKATHYRSHYRSRSPHSPLPDRPPPLPIYIIYINIISHPYRPHPIPPFLSPLSYRPVLIPPHHSPLYIYYIYKLSIHAPPHS